MPNMFGGDQLSEDYAPWFHEKRKAIESGEIKTITVEVTWTSSHILEVPDGMFPEMFAQQINDDMPQEVADQINSGTADMTSWEAKA